MDNYVLKKIINDQKGGTAVMMTIMILSSTLFLVLATGSIVQNGLKASKAQLHSAKAYYAAESGAERILWEARKNNTFVTDPLLSNPCQDGEFFCYDAPIGDEPYGDITSCNITCGAGELSQQFFSINSSNNVYYELRYETNIVASTTEITSTGTYIDPKNKDAFLSRVVKIYY
jgi:hypothetical protein